MHFTAFVAPGAVVVGDVTLAARSGVWFNTVVRADSAAVELGEDSNLQDNTVVHEDEGFPTRIGARVTVGHRSIIHGCVIEDECLIGMGAVVLSGARVGTGSLIGAGALVREGQVIPPGSLAVGAPARVLGPVSEAHRAAIENGWSHYAQLAREYLDRGHVRHLDRSGALLHDRPPMDEEEWRVSLQRFQRWPEGIARRIADRPSVAASAVEIGARLAARDRLQRESVLTRLAAGEEPMIETDAPPPSTGGEWRKVHEDWLETRRRLCATLDRLGPAWSPRVLHSHRGAFTVPELVRDWIEADREALEPGEDAAGPDR